jgi:hypothetical protein
MRSALVFAVLMIAPFAPLTTAGAVTTSVFAPLTGTVNVTTEALGVTGSIHVVTRCARTIPTDPCQIFVNLVGVEGEGQTTGLRYLGVGAGSVELPPNPIVPLVLTVALLPVGAPGLPPNPIQPDEAMRVTLTLEFDVASGVLLSVTAVASTPTPGE